jgi:hypothetical protein
LSLVLRPLRRSSFLDSSLARQCRPVTVVLSARSRFSLRLCFSRFLPAPCSTSCFGPVAGALPPVRCFGLLVRFAFAARVFWRRLDLKPVEPLPSCFIFHLRFSLRPSSLLSFFSRQQVRNPVGVHACASSLCSAAESVRSCCSRFACAVINGRKMKLLIM